MSTKKLLILFTICISSVTTFAQLIHTVAGKKNIYGYTGNGVPMNQSLFTKPFGIAASKDGSLYIGDWGNKVIRKIDPAGIVSTIAGTGLPGYTGDGGPALLANISEAHDIFVDQNNAIFFGDLINHVIRKVDPQGTITTVAGNGLSGTGAPYVGDAGPAVNAPLYDPLAITVDKNGNLYIANTAAHMISKVNTLGHISTICGQGLFGAGYTGDGGPAKQAKIYGPVGLAADDNNNIYFTELGNHTIRMIDPSGIIHTIAGKGIPGYSGDGGLAKNALLNRPTGLVIDASNNIYIAEENNHVIRKISANGIISTIAGTGVSGYSGDNGPAIAAKIFFPERLARTPGGEIYFTDDEHHTIRMIDACLTMQTSTVTINTSMMPVCPGKDIRFDASVTNAGASPSFQWKINGSNTGTNQSFFTSNTLQDGDLINCTVTNSTACINAVSAAIPVKVQLYQQPTPTLPVSVTIPPGTSTTLHPVIPGTANNTYNWTPATGLNNTSIKEPVASPTTTTTYQLHVVNSNGCEDSAKIKVVIYQPIYIPSAFTPNADGLNDIFKIPADNSLELEQLTIFDRWGNIVFTTSDIQTGWNGKFKGMDATPGIYIYLIKGKELGQPILLKGTISLIK